MDQLQLTETVVQGFAAVQLQNGLCSVTLVPALGGKITSLRDLHSGREWLWTNDRLPYRRVPHGTPYSRAADTGGWDECFPTVAPCRYPAPPWLDVVLADHGELWAQACELTIERDAGGGLGLVTELSGVALPYRFRRCVYLAPSQSVVSFSYTLISEADDPLFFIWCAHPLLQIEPGMRLVLPEGTHLQRELVLPATLKLPGEPCAWPIRCRLEDRDIDCTVLPGDSGIALKLWSAPLPAGRAALEAADGSLIFTFDPASLPHVGLWLNLGGWSGTNGPPYYNLGIEPSIGDRDSLEDAVRSAGRHGTLEPRETRTWSLDVQLRSTSAPPRMEQKP